MSININTINNELNTIASMESALFQMGVRFDSNNEYLLSAYTEEVIVKINLLRDNILNLVNEERQHRIDEELVFESIQNYYEDEFNTLVSEDACDGITDLHHDRRLSKDMMDRTISPKVWMRHGNSRIKKDGKVNFKRLHRERIEMMAL